MHDLGLVVETVDADGQSVGLVDYPSFDSGHGCGLARRTGRHRQAVGGEHRVRLVAARYDGEVGAVDEFGDGGDGRTFGGLEFGGR